MRRSRQLIFFLEYPSPLDWIGWPSILLGKGVELLIVKVGGSRNIDYEAVLEDLVEYEDWILIHGGSDQLNDISKQLGHPPRFVTSVSGYSSRYTDRETMEYIFMVYAGKMNKMIVEILQGLGEKTVGLAGLDGKIIECDRKSTLKIKRTVGKKFYGEITAR